jgi:hypothetical protein
VSIGNNLNAIYGNNIDQTCNEHQQYQLDYCLGNLYLIRKCHQTILNQQASEPVKSCTRKQSTGEANRPGDSKLKELKVLAGGLVMLVIYGAIQSTVIRQLAQNVHQLRGLQINALLTKGCQGSAVVHTFLVVAAACVRLKNDFCDTVSFGLHRTLVQALSTPSAPHHRRSKRATSSSRSMCEPSSFVSATSRLQNTTRTESDIISTDYRATQNQFNRNNKPKKKKKKKKIQNEAIRWLHKQKVRDMKAVRTGTGPSACLQWVNIVSKM